MYNGIDMVRSLFILVFIVLAQTSSGQIKEEIFEKLPGPRRSIISLNKEQRNFDRGRNIILNYRNQCTELATLTSPIIIYSNIYGLNGDMENEPLVQYHLFDRPLNPVIETNSMSYSERHFYMMEPVMQSVFTMKTEFGISIPELTTDRLSSHISSGFGYNMYYPQKHTGYYYFPIYLSFFYNFLK